MTEIRVFRHGLQHVDKNNVFALGKHFGSDTWDGRRAGAWRVGAPEKMGSQGRKNSEIGGGRGKKGEMLGGPKEERSGGRAVRERRAGWGKGGPVAPRNDKRKPLKPRPTHRESSTHPRNRYPHPRPETSTPKHTNHRHAHTHTHKLRHNSTTTTQHRPKSDCSWPKSKIDWPRSNLAEVALAQGRLA